MPYCQLEDVKKRLNIKEAITEFDNEINDLIEEATAEIDDRLSPLTTTPLASVPKTLRFACADLAAAMYQTRKKGPNDPKSVFYELYEHKMTTYIDAHYYKGAMGDD